MASFYFRQCKWASIYMCVDINLHIRYLLWRAKGDNKLRRAKKTWSCWKSQRGFSFLETDCLVAWRITGELRNPGGDAVGCLQIWDVKVGCRMFTNNPDIGADCKVGGFGTECQTLAHRWVRPDCCLLAAHTQQALVLLGKSGNVDLVSPHLALNISSLPFGHSPTGKHSSCFC